MNVSPTGVALQYAVTPHHSPTAPTMNQSITQPNKVYPTRENQANELFFFVIEGKGKKETFVAHRKMAFSRGRPFDLLGRLYVVGNTEF